MKTIKYFSVLLVVSLLAVSCGSLSSSIVENSEASGTLKTAGANQREITYDIQLIDHYFDGQYTTFTYQVTSNPAGGPAISHWDILIDPSTLDGLDISSNDSSLSIGPDGSTGFEGIKFDTGYEDNEIRIVTLVIEGEVASGPVEILVKSGNGFVLGSVEGPVFTPVSDDFYLISGILFVDFNGNGIQDSGEPVLSGVEIMINDHLVLTDSNGYYELSVEPGDYEVSASLPEGFLDTLGVQSVAVGMDDVVLDLFAVLNVDFLYGKTADGFTIGFWKNNIAKALSGKTKGVQISAETLSGYSEQISEFGLEPLNISSLEAAFSILSAKGSDPVVLLKKQLLASELNYFNGAAIDGNELYTQVLLIWGEYLITIGDSLDREILLNAKDIFDDYNNSHGEEITQ